MCVDKGHPIPEDILAMAPFVPKCSTTPVPTSKSTRLCTNMLTEQEVHALVEGLTMHGHMTTGDVELLVETLMV